MSIFILSTLMAVYLWLKWIVFLLFIPYIRKKGKREYLNMIAENNETKITDVSEDDLQLSKQNIKTVIVARIRRFIYGFIRYITFQIGHIPSHHIRNFLYKHVFMVNIDDKVTIFWDCEIRGHGKLSIGQGSIIGDHGILDARRGGINIGKNVNISNNVSLWTGQHDYNDPFFRSVPGRRGPIVIKDRVWIGPNVTILHSVTIGEGAVIAAGAVVTKDIPPYSLAGGIPAKVIGTRTRDLRYEFQGDHPCFY